MQIEQEIKTKNHKVLYVEDDKVDRLAFEKFVKDNKCPFEYIVASSIQEAKLLLDSKEFDVILSDYKLGDGVGMDLFEYAKGLPFVILTGTGSEGIAVNAIKSGVDDYIVKDYDRNYLKVLEITIEKAMAKKALELELKKKEEDLRQYAQELIRSNEELEQFAYVASHDLQEPLRMVKMFTELLEKQYKDKLDDQAKEYIHFAFDGAVRMQELINDLLEYGRINKNDEKFELVRFEEIINVILSSMSKTISESGAEITYDKISEVRANKIQLRSLFQNLIGNAIKFRSKEKPKIHISSKETQEEWTFSVRDNGIGIDPQYFERIFVIFQRLHTKEKYPGTGIGLATCKKIVNRHHGRIWVESEVAKGSTFYFTIPKEILEDGKKWIKL